MMSDSSDPIATAPKPTNVLVRQLMSQPYSLRLVLDGLPVHDGVLELLDDGLVDSITLHKGQKRSKRREWRTYEIFYSTGVLPQDNRCAIIWRFPLRFGVDSAQIQLLPHLLHQLIDVPSVLRADGTGIRDPV